MAKNSFVVEVTFKGSQILLFFLQDRVGQASIALSGDLDTPEGGFDGLMQTTICEQVTMKFFEGGFPEAI